MAELGEDLDEFSLDLGDLDLTSVDIDFDEVDVDLERFQQDDIVKEALSRGVDLRQYSRQIDEELKTVELESIRDYVNESDNVVKLHNQIQSCDGILARMQEMLLGFQADLGGISDEIKTLQDESHSMNVKLCNRREAEEKLNGFLQKTVVPPDLVTGICSSEVNESYMEYLEALAERLAYATQEAPPADGSTLELLPRDTASVRESLPKLEKLRLKAVAKVREHVLGKIAELRKPKTNVQMLQEQVLKRHSYVMQFLAVHAPEVATEVRAAYSDMMGKTLFALFKTYHVSLMKMETAVAARSDVLAAEDSQVRSMFPGRGASARAAATAGGNRSAVAFELGQRAQVLQDIGQPPILVHVAQAEGLRFPYERALRSVQMHLMNAATSEYLFTLDFFKLRTRELFLQIFARTLSLSLENVENHLFNCHDAVGILLMIRVTQAHRIIMERRRIPCLDAYFDRALLLLWPRYKAVLTAHITSLQTANVRRMGTVDIMPHYVTQRFAELAASVLLLHSNGADSMAGAAVTGDEMIMADLATLRTEFIKFLTRLSEVATPPAVVTGPRRASPRRTQLVFLINNFARVLEVFEERGVISQGGGAGPGLGFSVLGGGVGGGATGSATGSGSGDPSHNHYHNNGSSSNGGGSNGGGGVGGEGGSVGGGVAMAAEAAKFSEQLEAQKALYVEEELLEGFSRLIAFVQQTESQMTAAAGGGAGGGRGGSATPNVDAQMLEVLVREFASGWKENISNIYQSVRAHFSGGGGAAAAGTAAATGGAGMSMLKQVLTQLLLYYTRFQEIIRKCWTRPPPFAKDLVSTATILYEIKKYSHV